MALTTPSVNTTSGTALKSPLRSRSRRGPVRKRGRGSPQCAYLVGPVDGRGQRKGGNLIPFHEHHLDDREIVSRRIAARDDHAPACSAQVGVGHHHHIVDGVCHDVAVGQHMIGIDEKAGPLLRAAGDRRENEYSTLFEALRDGERRQIHGLCRNRGVGGRQGREGDAGDRFPGLVFRNVLAGGGFSGVRFRIRLAGIAVKEGFQLARRQFQQTLPERFFAEQVGPFRLACRLFGGLSRNRGRFRGNGLFLGRFYAGTQQEKQEYAQQDAEEQGSEEARLAAPDDGVSRRCPGNTCGGSGRRSGRARVLVPAEGPAARPAPGTALRAAVPATAAAEAPLQPLPLQSHRRAFPRFPARPRVSGPWLRPCLAGAGPS